MIFVCTSEQSNQLMSISSEAWAAVYAEKMPNSIYFFAELEPAVV